MSQTYKTQAKKIIKQFLDKGMIPLGYGSHKATFVHGNYIYKIAKSPSNIDDLVTEDLLYKNSKKGVIKIEGHKIHIAKCRLIFIDKFPVVIMEKLIPIDDEKVNKFYDKEKYKWMSYEYIGDGRQVGTDKKGRLKFFDYGSALTNNSNLIPKMQNSWCYATGQREKIIKSMDILDTNKFEDNYLSNEYLLKLGMGASAGSPNVGFMEKNKEVFSFV